MSNENEKKMITKQDKSLDELTEKTFQVAFNSLYASRKNILAFAGAMKLIRDKQLFLRKDYDSFDALCCSPEISIKPNTIETYIRLYEYWIEEQKKKMDDMAGIEFNKLYLLKKVKNPSKFFHDAKTLAFKDFKKLVMKEEFKLDPEDDGIQEYVHKKPCPNWKLVDGVWKCSAGIEIKEEPKSENTSGKTSEAIKGKSKKDDLI